MHMALNLQPHLFRAGTLREACFELSIQSPSLWTFFLWFSLLGYNDYHMHAVKCAAGGERLVEQGGRTDHAATAGIRCHPPKSAMHSLSFCVCVAGLFSHSPWVCCHPHKSTVQSPACWRVCYWTLARTWDPLPPTQVHDAVCVCVSVGMVCYWGSSAGDWGLPPPMQVHNPIPVILWWRCATGLCRLRLGSTATHLCPQSSPHHFVEMACYWTLFFLFFFHKHSPRVLEDCIFSTSVA